MIGGGFFRRTGVVFFLVFCVVSVSFARFEIVECISWGEPNHGRLINAEKLPAGEDYIIKSDSYTYATPETIEGILGAISHVKSLYPDAPDLVIGDLSKPKGGRYYPHASHQSGVDADLGYYFKDLKPAYFADANAWTIDVEKTWALIEGLLAGDKVKYIFIDYSLQRVLYFHALKKGVSRDALDKIFQYPRGYYVPVGIIRHDRGHRDHMHVRFKSPRAVMAIEKYTTDELWRMYNTQPSGGKVAFYEGQIVPVGNVVWHHVKSGETYYSIADKFSVSVTQLRLWNKGKRPLKPGMELAVYQPAIDQKQLEMDIAKRTPTKTFSVPVDPLDYFEMLTGFRLHGQSLLGSRFILQPGPKLPLP